MYRADDTPVRYFNRDGITITKWVVRKVTPMGCWVAEQELDWCSDVRFMRTDAYRRFAWPTEREALKSYLARKARQVSILRQKLWTAQEMLDAVRKRLGLPPAPRRDNTTFGDHMRLQIWTPPVADDR